MSDLCMTNVLSPATSVNVDYCKKIPPIVSADSLPHLCKMQFGDTTIWFRKDQLRELYAVVLAALEHFEAATRQPAPEPLLGSGADLFDGTEDMGTPTRLHNYENETIATEKESA